MDIVPAATRKGQRKVSPLESALLRAVASSGQEPVAQAIGKDISTVSRIFAGEGGIRIHDLETFLRSLGYKVVPVTQATIDPCEHRSLVELASRYLSAQKCGDEA